MDLILCHTTADFDTLGAAVGLTRLLPGARVVLTGGCHPTVRDFLALHRDEYRLIERRSVNSQKIRSISVVDVQRRDRLGKAAEWLNLPNLEITVYDHHLGIESDIKATRTQIESVGATTTLIVEQLQCLAEEKGEGRREKGEEEQGSRGAGEQGSRGAEESNSRFLTPAEATVMALGIHVDTGSLTFDHSTARDARALAWLMEQGASLSAIAEYVDPGLSPQLQELLKIALDNLQTETILGYPVAWVLLETDSYVPGLSSLASQLMEITESDALLLAHRYSMSEKETRLGVIGRSRISGTNLNELFKPHGGGGHPSAASVILRDESAPTLEQLVEQLKTQIPHPPVARDLMSSPVRTIRPETTIHEAQRILLRYGHSGLSVVDGGDRLVGVISRRDLDIALHHGFSHAPVKGYMTTNLKTIAPDTPLPEIEDLMVTYDIGRLPVLEKNRLVGIVTRTDVLRELHQNQSIGNRERTNNSLASYCPLPEDIQQQLRSRMAPELWELLASAARLAEKRGWHLYLVGGAVRDVLLAGERGSRGAGEQGSRGAGEQGSRGAEEQGSRGAEEQGSRGAEEQGSGGAGETENSPITDYPLPITNYPLPITHYPLTITDIDLVVDGFHHSADVGAGVELAKALQKQYRSPRLQVHGQFQTAALLWHKDPVLDSLWIDIATARTEFYPYPAANPEVEASSIRQDLYRRDFTINALAVRLTEPRAGELLDFFGGLLDLRSRSIRVLHPNSFIEDPTRIYRAVRFAVRLGFQIEPQTEGYIRHAIESGIYDRARSAIERSPALETRLKSELKYILQAPYWKGALQMLAALGALKCIHPTLELDRQLWKQVRLADRGLRRFDRDKTLEHWQMRLEAIVAHLQPEYRAQVAKTLQLADESIQRLSQLEQALTEANATLAQNQPPSKIVQLLRKYDVPTLILMAVKSSRRHRRLIWEYLTRWSHVKPLLDGNDLKALGYKPGPEFKKILDELLAATVDGRIGDRTDAKAFLAQHFPQ